jgi:CheY-like chemotaxis protein
VLIVDDRREVREGIRALLATEPTLRVVGEASSGDEALGVALVLRPDLIVLDHEMPGSRGLDVLPKLRAVLPGAGVVMFTMSLDIARPARLRGAEAVIAKDDLDGLLATLRRLAAPHVQPPAPVERPQRRPADRGWWVGVLLVPGFAVLYVASFVSLVAWFGDQTTDIAILVLASAGAAYGLRGGLIAAVLALPINAALIGLAGISVPGAGSVTRIVIALAIGAGFGRLRDLTVRANVQARALADTSAALEASDRRLFGLIEDAPVLIASIDTTGLIVDALGAGFEDYPKFSPERMRGQQAAVLYADNAAWLAQLSRALSGDEFSERVERSDLTYDVHFRPRHDQAGALVGTTAVLFKVSGRISAEGRGR